MATQIAFGFVSMNAAPTPAPYFIADTVVSEDVTPSASSAATTAAAPSGGANQPMCRIATDAAVYVSFGAAPDAESDASRLLIPAGATEYVYVDAGDKAAVVAVAEA